MTSSPAQNQPEAVAALATASMKLESALKDIRLAINVARSSGVPDNVVHALTLAWNDFGKDDRYIIKSLMAQEGCCLSDGD